MKKNIRKIINDTITLIDKYNVPLVIEVRQHVEQISVHDTTDNCTSIFSINYKGNFYRDYEVRNAQSILDKILEERKKNEQCNNKR